MTDNFHHWVPQSAFFTRSLGVSLGQMFGLFFPWLSGHRHAFLCKKCELRELQGIVDYLKCYSKESVNSFSKGWKWLLRNSGESIPTALSFYFYAWESFWCHYSMFSRLLMHDSYKVQIGNGRDWYYGRGMRVTVALADHGVVWEGVRPKLIGSFRLLRMSLYVSIAFCILPCSHVVINRGRNYCTFIWSLQPWFTFLGSSDSCVSLFLIIRGVTSRAV